MNALLQHANHRGVHTWPPAARAWRLAGGWQGCCAGVADASRPFWPPQPASVLGIVQLVCADTLPLRHAAAPALPVCLHLQVLSRQACCPSEQFDAQLVWRGSTGPGLQKVLHLQVESILRLGKCQLRLHRLALILCGGSKNKGRCARRATTTQSRWQYVIRCATRKSDAVLELPVCRLSKGVLPRTAYLRARLAPDVPGCGSTARVRHRPCTLRGEMQCSTWDQGVRRKRRKLRRLERLMACKSMHGSIRCLLAFPEGPILANRLFSKRSDHQLIIYSVLSATESFQSRRPEIGRREQHSAAQLPLKPNDSRHGHQAPARPAAQHVHGQQYADIHSSAANAALLDRCASCVLRVSDREGVLVPLLS